jgi:two-component system nitrate/nitrite response regulator NarL
VRRSVPTIILERRTLVREGIASLLSATSYKVIGSFASVSEMADMALPAKRAALIIMGIAEGVEDTVRTTQTIRRVIQDCKLVVVAEGTGNPDIEMLLNSEVDGVVCNVSSRAVLLKALELIFLEQRLIIVSHPVALNRLNPESVPPLASNDDPAGPETKLETETDVKVEAEPNGANGGSLQYFQAGLSYRERQVLLCVARGVPNKIIARECAIAEATVKVHIKAILRKIAVQNRTQAALWAVEHGLLDDFSNGTRAR